MESPKYVNLAYKLFQPTNGGDDALPPIIFLHGITSTKDYWDDMPQIIADKTKRKAYTVDARNHGDSGWSDDFSFDLSEDVLRFMDDMAMPRAVLIGHSMGGITALKTALEQPERFEMIFIEDIGLQKPPQAAVNRIIRGIVLAEEAVSQLPPEYGEREAFRFILNYIQSKVPANQLRSTDTESKFRLPLKRDADGRYCLKANTKALLRFLRSPGSLEFEFGGTFTGPACFLYGTESHIHLKEEEELLRKYFPRAELVEIKGADHFIHASFPKEFTETILQRMLKQ